MTSPNYVAYAPGVVFVDDVGGSGGTPFVATNFNGLRNDLATYIQNHINGVTNNHYTGDLLDATLPEITAYANATATNYQQFVRNDMFVTLFKQMLGGTGNLTARIATFLAATGSDMSSLFAAVTAGLTSGAANVNPNTIAHRDGSGALLQVIGTVPLLALRELLVLATATPSAAVIINPGSYIEQGTGFVRAYGGATISTLAAPGVGLERFDAVYLIANPSGVVTANILQGTAATIGTAGLPTVPDAGCLLAHLYMNGTTNTVYNQSTIAGQFAPGGASYILEGRLLRGGGAPADASLSMTKIKEFAPRPTTPPSLTVTVLGGGYFNSSNAPLKYAGSSFAYNGAANAALLGGTNPSLPTAGFARFDGMSIDLATNLLTVTPGVPSNSGAEGEPGLPLTGRPVGYVHVTATTTAIYGSFTAMFAATGGTTQGFIDDFFRMGAGGGTSGSSLTTITPAHVVSGNDATYQDGFLAQASPVVTPNLPGYIQPTGNLVQIIATQANPVKVSWNGVERRYPDPTIVNPPYLSTTAIGSGQATASGAAGYRYLVADKSVAGVKTFGATIMTALPTSPDQALLATLWWDGTSLVTVPDLGAILNVDSALVNKRGAQVQWTGQNALSSTSLAFPATMPSSLPFIVPPNARVRFTVRVRGYYHAGGTPISAEFLSWVYLDGTTQLAGTQIDSTNYSADGPLRETVVDDVLSGPSSLTTPGSFSTAITPGQHTLSWAYLVQGTATFDASIVKIQADVFRAGGN